MWHAKGGSLFLVFPTVIQIVLKTNMVMNRPKDDGVDFVLQIILPCYDLPVVLHSNIPCPSCMKYSLSYNMNK